MFQFKVLAVRDVSFPDNETGKQVEGKSVWCSSPCDRSGWRGVEVLKLWFPANSPFIDVVDALLPDQVISVSYNRYGKIDSLEVLQ